MQIIKLKKKSWWELPHKKSYTIKVNYYDTKRLHLIILIMIYN